MKFLGAKSETKWISGVDFRFFEGEPKDEIGVDPEKFAVEPALKIATTWGKLRKNPIN